MPRTDLDVRNRLGAGIHCLRKFPPVDRNREDLSKIRSQAQLAHNLSGYSEYKLE